MTDILTAGKYFIDTQVLSAYTSAVKKQCFVNYQICQRPAPHLLLILDNLFSLLTGRIFSAHL